tara:strand:- start:1263 stop:1811 length:549 start_codon:yes stop_codon:yes gene_type:complete
MYAIVEIAGQQYKVQKDQQLFVHRLEGKEGSKVSFDNVLLTANGDKIDVGAPAIKGVSVSAKIIEHLKGDKVIVFKKKRRKGYKVKNGHRQQFSKIQIEAIGASAPKAASTEKAKEVEKPKAEAPKAEAKAETKKPATEAKKTPAKEVKKPTKAATESKKEPVKKAAAKPKAAAKKETKKED